MKLETSPVGNWIEGNLQNAQKVTIVSPFFSMSDSMKEVLRRVPDLHVIVGDEFEVNNPLPLEDLAKYASVKCAYRTTSGRLHAKVVDVVDNHGNHRVLLGSANFTSSGLWANQELDVSLDSKRKGDARLIAEVGSWIQKVVAKATVPDWTAAEETYMRHQKDRVANAQKRLPRKSKRDPNYWILKTTERENGPSHWRQFLDESVLAIGWTNLESDRDTYDYDSLSAEAHRFYDSARSANHGVTMIDTFTTKWSVRDKVIVCTGYNSTQNKLVHIYGTAVVTGDMVFDATSNWWSRKRSATIVPLGVDIPKEVFIDSIGKESRTFVIHGLSKQEYRSFKSELQKHLEKAIAFA